MSTRRKVWVATFLTLTGAAVGMELVAGIIWPGPDRPAWTDLIAGNVPQDITTAAVGLLVAWLPGHFVDAYRRRATTPQPVPSTQSKYPWRATARTVFAMVVGGASLLPTLVAMGHIPTVGAVGQVLAVAATVTRILAMPSVEQFLATYLPWLAPVPPAPTK